MNPGSPTHLSGAGGLAARSRTPHRAGPDPLPASRPRRGWAAAAPTLGAPLEEDPPLRQEGKWSVWLFWQNLEREIMSPS